jgi:hypothetical protein
MNLTRTKEYTLENAHVIIEKGDSGWFRDDDRVTIITGSGQRLESWGNITDAASEQTLVANTLNQASK